MDETSKGDALPEVFTLKQVAARFGCSARTLKERVRKYGCFHKIGQTMFMTREDVDTFLDAIRPMPKAQVRPPPRHRVRKNKRSAAGPTEPLVVKAAAVPRPEIPIKFLRSE